MNRKRIRTKLNLQPLDDRCVPAAGFLDPTFAGDGMTATNFKMPDSQDRAHDVAVYPGSSAVADGKILVVGTTVTRIVTKGNQSLTNGWDWDFGLARYNPDGSLDASFGQGGKATTAIGSGTARDVAVSVELTSNKILAAGYSEGGGFALARYNDNGSLDSTFGSQGKVLTKISGGGRGLAMKVDDAGKIIMAGTDGGSALAVVRYNANGALDKLFGKAGIANTSFGEPVAGDFVGQMELAITPASAGPANAGKILVVGLLSNSNSLLVARYTTAGVLDTTFDNDGVLLYSGPSPSSLPSVAIQQDGRIVVGYSSAGVPKLLRLNANGTLDMSFDGNGMLTANGYATSVASQPDGKIVLAGAEYAPGVGGNFFVARLTADGQLDTTFGTGGVGKSTDNTLAAVGTPSVEIDLDENGKLVVCGWTDVITSSGHVSDFAVARFLGDDALRAAASAPNPTSQTLTAANLQPLVNEAFARWHTSGVDTSRLGGINIRIADLGGTTLGLASGNTIWLDDNAAGWGWFVDRTPRNDSEFMRRGNQGEQNRMDLLTVLTHEVEHLLGHEHETGGVMADSLLPGTRRMPEMSRIDWQGALGTDSPDSLHGSNRKRSGSKL